jgi:Ner family transcriptional regulator
MSGQAWHRQDIIAAVRKTGTNLRRLSLAKGFAEATLLRSLDRRWPNCHAVIARHLGVSCHAIWPHWYEPNGRPRFRLRQDLRRYAAPVTHEAA